MKIRKEIIGLWHDENPILLTSDIISQLEAGDEISAGILTDYDAGDSHFSFEVSRMVDETPEQMDRRIEFEIRNDERNRVRRYEKYLKLKEEFENK